MLPKTELAAYQAAINLPLLSNIVAFVLETAETPMAQRKAIYRTCPLLCDATADAFQERYGFLYLGELLERYEERFGMTDTDLRAIALALAYTRDATTDAMFVGSQKADFLRRLRRSASGDIYLTGALYLIGDGQDARLEAELIKLCNSTEKLLFALSLFQNHERAFTIFKPQLLSLLGSNRTMPVIGNMKILDWLIVWLAPILKSARGKDLSLFRALCALPSSFVKPESKHHAALLEYGYTPLDIAYANMMAVLAQSAKDVLSMDSIVTEKIAIALFQNVLTCESPLSPETYEQLSTLYSQFRKFRIKCYGCENLQDALKEGPRIANAETFIWFSGLTDIYHTAFDGFDILDKKWDKLSSSLDAEKYFRLFERSLSNEMDAEHIRRRIAHYDALTGHSYIEKYYDNRQGDRFGLLVIKGIFDLWTVFLASLSPDGSVARQAMIENIRSYVSGIKTIQVYRFYEHFFAAYGVAGLERFFGGYRREDFRESLTARNSYIYGSSRNHIELNIERDFLDEDGRRQLLLWLEEYIFFYEPDRYLALCIAILRDESVASLLPMENQRALFSLVAGNVDRHTLNELKRRYLTPEQLQAEQEARAAAEREAERQRQSDLLQSLRDKFAEITDGKFKSVLDYLNKYRYHREECRLTCGIVSENIDRLLTEQDNTLDNREAVQFLRICARLIEQGAMSFQTAQDYISRIKESDDNDADLNTAC